MPVKVFKFVMLISLAIKLQHLPGLAQDLIGQPAILDAADSQSNWLSKEPNEDSLIRIELSNSSKTAGGFIFATRSDAKLNLSDVTDVKLLEIISRNSPDVRSSRDNRDFYDVTLNVSKRAWLLLHEHTRVAIENKINLAQPAIEKLLMEAKVSSECLSSTRKVFEGAKRMESWALKLLNSWGNFPSTGLFEGTYTEIGSYHVCKGISKNPYIDHAHYCSITLRPVMPSHKDYHLIIQKEANELLRLFDRTLTNNSSNRTGIKDAFTDILEQANYFHYLYFKWGTCWPIACSPFDVKRISRFIARTNILLSGPVKCYSNFGDDYEEPGSINLNESTKRKLKISTGDENDGIFIWKPQFTTAQLCSTIFLCSLVSFIIIMTLIDLLVIRLPDLINSRNKSFSSPKVLNKTKDVSQIDGKNNLDHSFALIENSCNSPTEVPLTGSTPVQVSIKQEQPPHPSRLNRKAALANFMTLVDDCSLISNYTRFLTIQPNQLRGDISCLYGIRCITMIWIIIAHTMMYNDWGAFARTKEIEKSLNSVLTQPLFNGSYLVDTFFLMSGLLTAFTVFRNCQGLKSKFRTVPFLVGRWLRLTPQIFLVSMIYIVLPLANDGPHWYQETGEYSENCSQNWWINMFHLQAFYKIDYMCNFVTWWVSIDSFYHVCTIFIIWLILLAGHKAGFIAITFFIGSHVAWQGIRHYELALPPNLLSTIPQTGSMWGVLTLKFFWKTYSHTVPFFTGFYLGYLIAMKSKIIIKFLNPRRATIGWTLAISGLLTLSYSTYWWVLGKVEYGRLTAAIFHVICPFIWAASFSWFIIACHFGYGGCFNRFMTSKVFLILGKASYLIYLSHFQVVFSIFGSQNLLLEPTPISIGILMLGIVTISTFHGVFMCIFFEFPWLRIQRRLMKLI